MVFAIIVSFLLAAFIAWRWVQGITHMMEEHPDYKGEDLFDEDPKNMI